MIKKLISCICIPGSVFLGGLIGSSDAQIVTPPANGQGQNIESPQFAPAASSSRDHLLRRLEWGVSVMPLPSYLRSDVLGLVPGQGLLVTGVEPYGPAAQAGLRQGHLLLDVDGLLLNQDSCLPALDRRRCVLVMTDQGLIEVNIESLRPQLPQYQLGARAFFGNFPAYVTAPIATAEILDRPSCIRSLAMSEWNGDLEVSAIVDDVQGPRHLELRGTREEIECQLRELSPELQRALRPQIGF